MAVKVFPASRTVFKGRLKDTGSEVEWVAFDSALWQVASTRLSRRSAVELAERMARMREAPPLRVVKGTDGEWHVVQQSRRVRAANIRR